MAEDIVVQNNNIPQAINCVKTEFPPYPAALVLSAPSSEILFKNRKNHWVQLAGHHGSFAPAGPKTIWKKRLAKENSEASTYQELMADNTAVDIVPKFYREVKYNGDYYIEIEDLLHHFDDPSIMDIKMGTRTFLESEVKNAVMRKDLYEKMITLNPKEPTAEEHEQMAVTKLRYMQFRERGSSTADLGFRIEAVRMSGEPPNNDLKKIRTEKDVQETLETFMKSSQLITQKVVKRLQEIRSKFEESNYFRCRELIGSSLLILYDKANNCGVWLIDFGKTLHIPGGLNHRSPWQLGNHEDGYLTGLDNLIWLLSPTKTEEAPVVL